MTIKITITKEQPIERYLEKYQEIFYFGNEYFEDCKTKKDIEIVFNMNLNSEKVYDKIKITKVK